MVCGHIHQPEVRLFNNSKGSVLYLNSGDWIENLTALEYEKGEWKIFNYQADYINPITETAEETEKLTIPTIATLYEHIVRHTGNG